MSLETIVRDDLGVMNLKVFPTALKFTCIHGHASGTYFSTTRAIYLQVHGVKELTHISGHEGKPHPAMSDGIKEGASFVNIRAVLRTSKRILVLDQDRVRVVSLDGYVQTYYFDDENEVSRLKTPTSIIQRADDTFYISDSGNHMIFELSGDPGSEMFQLTDLCGSGAPGLVNGPFSSSLFFLPHGLALNEHGDLLVADSGNNVIRKLDFETRSVRTEVQISVEQQDQPSVMIYDLVCIKQNIFFSEPYKGSITVWNGSKFSVLPFKFKMPWVMSSDLNGDIFVLQQASTKIEMLIIHGGGVEYRFKRLADADNRLDVGQDLYSLLVNGDTGDIGDMGDIVLRVGGENFRAHKFILKARSAYFATMLRWDSNMLEIPLLFEHIEDEHARDVFPLLLKYFYTGIVPSFHLMTKIGQIEALVYMADMYSVDTLVEKCIGIYIKRILTVENIIDRLMHADAIMNDRLKKAIWCFLDSDVNSKKFSVRC